MKPFPLAEPLSTSCSVTYITTSSMVVSWTYDSSKSFVTHWQPEYRVFGTDNWIPVIVSSPDVRQATIEPSNAAPGSLCDVRVAAISGYGPNKVVNYGRPTTACLRESLRIICQPSGPIHRDATRSQIRMFFL